MYAQAAIKPNPLLRNGEYGHVYRGVQKCTCAGASLWSKNSAPLCCIKLDTATDVGCGSGALTIACAKRNLEATMVGCDIWRGAYKAVFSKKRCEDNTKIEHVKKRFEEGNAIHAPFSTESFDAVTSNYVYHNISGQDKQKLLLETLRVLKRWCLRYPRPDEQGTLRRLERVYQNTSGTGIRGCTLD